MLKRADPVKSIESDAVEALRALLQQVPAIKLVTIERETALPDRGVDFVAHIETSGKRHALVCEVKSIGQPRYVRMASLQLRDYIARHAYGAIPVLITPYLSPEAQALCRKESLGFVDFEGNAHLQFESVFIERSVAGKPVIERRALKSLFKPRSAQVLRVMFRDPNRAWRVADLASAADVSLGHVSNIRAALLDREWAHVSNDGLLLSAPDALLDAWRDAYEPPAGKRMGFYTPLHGRGFEDTARQILQSDGNERQAAFASFSAAHWLAPYGRTGTQYFYADDRNTERLQTGLKLSSVSKGENVVVTCLKDPGVLLDTVEPAPGAICTSPIQTYLDLTAAGERGREAADYLRSEKLTWSK